VYPQFVYVTDRRGAEEIWLKGRQEGYERPLVTPKDFPDSETRSFLAPVFSPDGQRIAYERVGERRGAIWISPVSGGQPTRLTAEQDAAESPPAWSPDGNWLAYRRVQGGKSSLVKAKLGSREAPVVIRENVPGFVPQWSPTGEWLTCPQPNGMSLISPDGKQIKPLGVRGVSDLVWSKDGKTLYGVRRENGKPALLSVSVETGSEKIIGEIGEFMPLSPHGPGIRLSLSPDGKSIIYGFVRPRSELWLLEGFDPPPGALARLLRRP